MRSGAPVPPWWHQLQLVSATPSPRACVLPSAILSLLVATAIHTGHVVASDYIFMRLFFWRSSLSLLKLSSSTFSLPQASARVGRQSRVGRKAGWRRSVKSHSSSLSDKFFQQHPRVYLCPDLGLALGSRLLKTQTDRLLLQASLHLLSWA